MECMLSFDSKTYSVDAIMATAYWCADRIICDIITTDAGWDIVLHGRNGREITPSEIDEFKTMLLHNQIRQRLSEKLAPIEKAIIEKAFAPVTAKER